MSHLGIILNEAAKDDVHTGEGSHRTTIATAPDPDAAARKAVALVEAGADSIELCGATGPVWQARVLASVGDRASVGVILYGFESLDSVQSFKAGFELGEDLTASMIYLQPGADPTTDRMTVEDESGRTNFIAVPDAAAAVTVAASEAAAGARLIELYGGIDPKVQAEVIAATGDGRVPIGVIARAR
ncbi:hypothetical protein UA75_23405 [Actinoalloteichus sp. GBA129-24]|uniref:Uncharacterized protein n=2 Tax=Pseudonocardiaceae TaxID=2070 RepID=A0AAC9PU00_9PSEU|nr:hypothetical protein UA74_22895 [Actinoalloteichus fjordicus]APU22663.1 hypothetical protein UA75_23405 [Actinoalloteichus sp. GBA129-24]